MRTNARVETGVDPGEVSGSRFGGAKGLAVLQKTQSHGSKTLNRRF